MIDAARRVAWDVMRAVDERDAYVNLLLPRLLRERSVQGRDAAFATELTHGTIRREGTYDAILDRATSKGVDAVDPPVRDVLRLGCHQLLAMRTPRHAAVSTSVDLVRAGVGHRPASFVNAVLRKVSQNDLDGWLTRISPADGDPRTQLSVRHSHPRWVVDALADTVGGDEADLARLLEADNQAPEVTLVARPGLSSRDELLTGPGEPGDLSPYAVRLGGGDPGEIPAVRDGRAGVQDEGSQLVAIALADAPLEGPDTRWLDLCAGPGGKAALLAGLAAARDATLVANEVQPHRATLVEQALRHYDNARVTVHDGRTADLDGGGFDRVLVDAPCTGLGALRRRPEARWRRRPEDVADLVALQRALLEHALDLTRAGGVVAYATCSPHLEETTGVVDAVLGARDGIEIVDVGAVLPQVPSDGRAGPHLQLWPHRHGTDAMFTALLRPT